MKFAAICLVISSFCAVIAYVHHTEGLTIPSDLDLRRCFWIFIVKKNPLPGPVTVAPSIGAATTAAAGDSPPPAPAPAAGEPEMTTAAAEPPAEPPAEAAAEADAAAGADAAATEAPASKK